MIQVLRERHEAPPEIRERLNRAGGLNPYGEPNFRVVWGWNRMEWNGQDYWPKYLPAERWHLEAWLPPEKFGSIEQWREEELGPFPSRGDYELCYTLQDVAGNFLPLTPTAAERLALMVKISRGFTSTERKTAYEQREEKKDRDYDSWAFDVLDDGVRAFHQQPFVTVPKPAHANRPRNGKEALAGEAVSG